ncbi:MAG: flavin-dependent oxidoreductase [Alphaproteobacteria bacterium]|nr:flavin-dependent oxidoreductase [Alphaproteobacteria bacterium]MBU1513355.1 flavin-dependent oxidoreductase [Alphaproteobacteria bacterium]MBU2096347.1 flavin-dependent oxidoreductase [Alphaproteobacteria bacterium]MBU2149961.1 flavin-dependent oxidoreductase [Alphaproteobacteria bacterium]MBU2309841.1 flavin-dependent oxidoreductase [Alphaproteobacteria bacterium]
MRVVIVGAGIGGLTAALSLHAAGVQVEVHEAVQALRPLGVGINLLPHAVRELTELGLADRIAEVAIATQALVYANRHGQEIWREPRGLAAGYHWPQYSINRGTLQMLLLAAVRERLGPDAVRLGRPARGFATDTDGATVRFQDGAQARGDVVVAADGIHSALRAQAYPDEGPPIWNRRVLWRGVTEAPPYLGGATMVMAGHAQQKFVCYPIDPAAAARGRSLVNWIAELRFPDETEWRREDWNRPGRLADFLPQFESWDFGWLDAPAVIAGAAQVLEYPMVDRDPVDRWTFGRMTLLGDAAHAMYPIGSNGASQAILDARTLAFQLATQPDIDTGLQAYEAERRPPTSRLVLANRGEGPERVMQLAEDRAPAGFADVTDIIPRAELEAVADGYKQVAGFDREALNARASLTPGWPA